MSGLIDAEIAAAMTLLLIACVYAQAVSITDIGKLQLNNAQASIASFKGKQALRLASTIDGYAVIKDVVFHNGTIEVDVAGSPAANAGEAARGFIGVAFRVQDDGRHLEQFYIRPTNGRTPDQLRRNHATQYISAPDWPWERLRKEMPGVYESYADMVPGEWIHLKIVIHGTEGELYVGGASQPCLLVHDLKMGDVKGGVALWTGPGTEGYFSNLRIYGEGDKARLYGADPVAGKFIQASDAKLYYERYGDGGRPLVLLHGGEYGYIDEFASLIAEMSKTRTVIALATRGYGRSERGRAALSHRQFAADAVEVLKRVVPAGEKVDVLGFSEGAITSYILASGHPELVHRLVAIGGGLGRYGLTKQADSAEPLTPELMQKQVPGLVASRKAIMAKPELWEPLIRELEAMYQAPVYVKPEEIQAIQVPTLVMAGDHDFYNRTEHTVEIYQLLPKGQLAIIPGCGHVVLDCKADVVIGRALTFLDQ